MNNSNEEKEELEALENLETEYFQSFAICDQTEFTDIHLKLLYTLAELQLRKLEDYRKGKIKQESEEAS